MKRGAVSLDNATRAGVAHRGSSNGRAKLTERDAADILRSYAAGMSVSDMAAVLGVTHSAVASVVAGRSWRHVSLGADAVEDERVESVRQRLGFVPSHVRRGK